MILNKKWFQSLLIELKSDRFISKSFQIIGLGMNSNKSPTYNSSLNVSPYIFFNIDSIGILTPPSGETNLPRRAHDSNRSLAIPLRQFPCRFSNLLRCEIGIFSNCIWFIVTRLAQRLPNCWNSRPLNGSNIFEKISSLLGFLKGIPPGDALGQSEESSEIARII